MVADDNLWRPVHGGVPGLLRAPLVGRRIRHRGMENRSATQVQEEEYEHLAEPHVERLHEVTRPRHVVSQERRPALPVASGSIAAQVPLNVAHPHHHADCQVSAGTRIHAYPYPRESTFARAAPTAGRTD